MQANPQRFLGFQLGIPGMPSYHFRHPYGADGGWNVCFVGLTKESEPLFLAARGVGKNYLITNRELHQIFVDGFNKFPQYQQRKTLTCEFRFFLPFGANHWSAETGLFNLARVKSFVQEPDRFQIQLKQYCDQTYQTILNLKVTCEKRGEENYPGWLSSQWIKQLKEKGVTKDDHDKHLLHFFKKSRRVDNKLISKDDSEVLMLR